MAAVRVHLAVSAVLAAVVGATTRSFLPAAGTLAAGVLIDADHVVDYVWCRRRARRDRVVLPFHGWEFAIALVSRALRRPSPVWLALALAYGIHLIIDLFANSPRTWLGYSILYRAAGVFSHERFCRPGKDPHPWMVNGLFRAIAFLIS